MKRWAGYGRKTVCSAGLLALLGGCDFGLDDARPNEPPNTSLANIPVEGDTLFALVTLHWNGGDADGFVDTYEYRHVSTYLSRGDSVAQDWTRTQNTGVTLAFSSIDPLNRQRFEVRAIDNDGEPDPTPAVKTFYTSQTFVPEVDIVVPRDGQQFLALERTSDWWQGIPLTFTGRDEDGDVVEYGWAVDDGPWNWTRDTTLYIPPAMFASPLEGTHTVRVTARDDTDMFDPQGTEISVALSIPRFDRELLILDETNEANFNPRVGYGDDEVDAFYADLFGQADTWDYYAEGGLPSPAELGRYRYVVWHADDKPTNAPHALALEVESVKDYLNVGGNIVMSGWRVLKSFAWRENFPLVFGEGTFVNDYMQIGLVEETPLLADFTGATGVGGFPDIRVDASKLDFFPNNGVLNQVNIIRERGGFTEIAVAYDTSPQTSYPEFRGSVVGLIYFGTSFDAAILGFPLFFIEREDAKRFATAIMDRMRQ